MTIKWKIETAFVVGFNTWEHSHSHSLPLCLSAIPPRITVWNNEELIYQKLSWSCLYKWTILILETQNTINQTLSWNKETLVTLAEWRREEIWGWPEVTERGQDVSNLPTPTPGLLNVDFISSRYKRRVWNKYQYRNNDASFVIVGVVVVVEVVQWILWQILCSDRAGGGGYFLAVENWDWGYVFPRRRKTG